MAGTELPHARNNISNEFTASLKLFSCADIIVIFLGNLSMTKPCFSLPQNAMRHCQRCRCLRCLCNCQNYCHCCQLCDSFQQCPYRLRSPDVIVIRIASSTLSLLSKQVVNIVDVDNIVIVDNIAVVDNTVVAIVNTVVVVVNIQGVFLTGPSLNMLSGALVLAAK